MVPVFAIVLTAVNLGGHNLNHAVALRVQAQASTMVVTIGTK